MVIGGTSLSGGRGTMLGTIIGALIISVLTNGLRILSVPQEWQTVVTGVIIILAVYADILRRRNDKRLHGAARPDQEHEKAVTSRRLDCIPTTQLREEYMFNRRTSDSALASAPPPSSTARRPLRAGNLYIALISKGFQHQFWQAVKAGAEQAAKRTRRHRDLRRSGNRSPGRPPDRHAAAALAKKPAGHRLRRARQPGGRCPLLQQAKDAGIPVIAFDSGVDSDIPLTTCTTDNVAAAALAADKMAELIGGEGKVAIVSHDQTSRTGIDRARRLPQPHQGEVSRRSKSSPSSTAAATS